MDSSGATFSKLPIIFSESSNTYTLFAVVTPFDVKYSEVVATLNLFSNSSMEYWFSKYPGISPFAVYDTVPLSIANF